MSKGKDFRGPRKRGFDDDGPMPYDPRPRGAPRHFDGGGFGGPSPMSPPPVAAGPAVDAVVKWFKADKGYGFVELANGQGDAFLHINALHASGFDTVPPGAKLKVNVGAGAKGAQVTRVLEVDTSTAVSVAGKVKWFDDAKGFGFVASDDGGKDVFVHISILGPSGITHLTEGQPVNMRVVDTPKGREAISISPA